MDCVNLGTAKQVSANEYEIVLDENVLLVEVFDGKDADRDEKVCTVSGVQDSGVDIGITEIKFIDNSTLACDKGTIAPFYEKLDAVIHVANMLVHMVLFGVWAYTAYYTMTRRSHVTESGMIVFKDPLGPLEVQNISWEYPTHTSTRDYSRGTGNMSSVWYNAWLRFIKTLYVLCRLA